MTGMVILDIIIMLLQVYIGNLYSILQVIWVDVHMPSKGCSSSNCTHKSNGLSVQESQL